MSVPQAKRILPATSLPALIIENRQRLVSFDIARVKALAGIALPHCLQAIGPKRSLLRSLTSIDVSILSNRTIARLHRQFLGLVGPTDVITFPYGEILIGAGIAQENAFRFGGAIADEISLYVIHGLLHLNGFDDVAPEDAAQMRRTQAKILKACLAAV